MKKKASNLIRGGEKFVSIMSKICTAVDEAGGCDDDVAALDADTPGAKKRLGQIAEILRGSAASEERALALVDNALYQLNHQESDYFTPLSDADVPEQYQATLAKYRKLATEHGVSAVTAVCYKVKAGFTLKTYAPKLGPCYENYKYLQNWYFTDEATVDCLVLWVPRIIKGSTSKTKNGQIQLLADLRTRLELPAHHMSGFGQVGLVAGLILAHFKATGERIPLNEYWVRTDTCEAEGGRLSLGKFGGTGLRCRCWGFGGDVLELIGVFAIGVEKL